MRRARLPRPQCSSRDRHVVAKARAPVWSRVSAPIRPASLFFVTGDRKVITCRLAPPTTVRRSRDVARDAIAPPVLWTSSFEAAHDAAMPACQFANVARSSVNMWVSSSWRFCSARATACQRDRENTLVCSVGSRLGSCLNGTLASSCIARLCRAARGKFSGGPYVRAHKKSLHSITTSDADEGRLASLPA